MKEWTQSVLTRDRKESTSFKRALTSLGRGLFFGGFGFTKKEEYREGDMYKSVGDGRCRERRRGSMKREERNGASERKERNDISLRSNFFNLKLCFLRSSRDERSNGSCIDSTNGSAVFALAAVLSNLVGEANKFCLVSRIGFTQVDDGRALFVDDALDNDFAFIEASEGEFGGLFRNRFVKVQFSLVVESLTKLLNGFDEFSLLDHVVGKKTLEGCSDHPVALDERPKQKAKEFEHVVVLINSNQNVVNRRLL